MKTKYLAGWISALCLSVLAGQAQPTNQAASVSHQIEQLEKQQREMRETFERMLHEQQAQIEELKKQLAAVTTNAPAPADSQTADQIKDLSDKVDSVVAAQTKSLPNEFNPSIGFVGETILSYRSRGSENTGSDRPGGFDAFQRSMELDATASVDPFAKAYLVANASADAATGKADLALEEAAIQTTSLPGNIELKAGRFFGEFGRLAYIHDHELPFVNRPLVLDQYIGGESRTDGAQINWLLPVPHFFSLTLGTGSGFGGDIPPSDPNYRPLGGLTYFGRLSTFFNLTPDWNLETGISGLINPDAQDVGGTIAVSGVGTATEQQRRVAGLDVKLNWLPLQNNEFHSLSWGTEVLYSDSQFRFDPDGLIRPGTSADEFERYVGSLGLYSYVTYKWSRQWSAGFLFDYVQSPQNHRAETFAYSPYLTWAISHWNQVRLQYTHTEPTESTGFKPDDAVYLQWAWIIGSHAHGWQQR